MSEQIQDLNRLALLANRTPTHEPDGIGDRSLEFADEEYYRQLRSSLKALGNPVETYTDLERFTDDINRFRNGLVLSVWSGKASRNRRGLVPAVCEANDVPYVGPDAYTSVVCQDKELSKRIVEDVGLETPPGVLVRGPGDVDRIDRLNPPFVVKPNYEGGSIGISSSNKIETKDEAKKLALELLSTMGDDVLVEEFVPGREVYTVLTGRRQELEVVEAVEQEVPGIDLSEDVYGYEYKKSEDFQEELTTVTGEVDRAILRAQNQIFNRFQKVELMRIDGRLRDGTFTCLELTPDAYLGKDGSVFHAFREQGMDHAEMVRYLVRNALRS